MVPTMSAISRLQRFVVMRQKPPPPRRRPRTNLRQLAGGDEGHVVQELPLVWIRHKPFVDKACISGTARRTLERKRYEVAESALRQALPSRETLAALAAKAVARLEEPRRQDGAIEEYEPRGYWEEGGVKANETMVEAQFL